MLVTTLAERLAVAPARPVERRRAGPAAEHASLAVFVGWWVGPLVHASGGRDGYATAIGLLLVVPLLVTTRCWLRVPRSCLALSVLVPTGALAMCLFAPGGWLGADDLAGYTLAALAFPALLAYARTSERRTAVVAVLVGAGLLQFAMGFLAWWGSGDPSSPMVGTFFWWNPYAAYLLVPALLGLAVVLFGERPWVLLGAVTAPLCAAGIVLSSSRATLALLCFGAVVLAGAAGISARGARATCRVLVRWLLVVSAAAAVAFSLTGPPFFPERASVTAATQARADDHQSVANNTMYRTHFWRRALAVTADRPVFGAGAHQLASASEPLVPEQLATSKYAHSGYLQPLSDGGLVLGVPFLLAVLLAVAGLLRRAWRGVRARSTDRLLVVLPVAALASLAHGGVDFDWTYPAALLMTVAVTALALAVPLPEAPRTTRTGRPLLMLWPVAACLLVAVSAVAVVERVDSHVAVTGDAATAAEALRSQGSRPFADTRSATALLQLAAGASGPVLSTDVAPADIRWALGRTARLAEVDAGTALLRARGMQSVGDSADALSVVNGVLSRLGPTHAPVYLERAADVVASAGEPDRAASLLVTSLGDSATLEHHGLVLRALLRLDGYANGPLARCAWLSVPADARLAGTPEPGSVPPGTPCARILKEKAS